MQPPCAINSWYCVLILFLVEGYLKKCQASDAFDCKSPISFSLSSRVFMLTSKNSKILVPSPNLKWSGKLLQFVRFHVFQQGCNEQMLNIIPLLVHQFIPVRETGLHPSKFISGWSFFKYRFIFRLNPQLDMLLLHPCLHIFHHLKGIYINVRDNYIILLHHQTFFVLVVFFDGKKAFWASLLSFGGTKWLLYFLSKKIWLFISLERSIGFF